MTLADRIVVMNGGRIEQVGTPLELYNHPRTRFVAGFIGSPAMNFLPCRLIERGARTGGRTRRRPVAARAGFAHGDVSTCVGRMVLGLRPEHITERRSYVDGAEFTRPVDVLEPMGTETMVHLEIAGADVCARCSPEISARPARRWFLWRKWTTCT